MNVNSYRLNQLISNGTIKAVKPLSRRPLYFVGKTYWCGYWQKYYTVLDVDYEKVGKYKHLKSVSIRWEDGETGKHCTSLDSVRDYELILTA